MYLKVAVAPLALAGLVATACRENFAIYLEGKLRKCIYKWQLHLVLWPARWQWHGGNALLSTWRVSSPSVCKSGSCTFCSGQLGGNCMANALLTNAWRLSSANVHIIGSCTFCSGQLGGDCMARSFALYLEDKLRECR